MQIQKPVRMRKRGAFPWRRLLIITVLFLFLVIAAIVLLLSTGHIIDYFWYYIIPVTVMVLSTLLTALQWLFPLSPIETQELNKGIIDQKQELLRIVEGLSSGVNIGIYQDKFGKPIFTQQIKEKSAREYIFVNPYCYVKAATDTDDTVLYFAITIRDKTFNPVFKSPDYPVNDTSFHVTLGVSTFSDVPGSPEYIVGRLGAHDFSYYETRYLGNPGHYQNFGFGLNQAGYLPNNAGQYLSVLTNNPHYDHWSATEQDLKTLEALIDLRTKLAFNTYAISAPSVAIKDFADANLGVNYYQVRTLNT